MRRAAVLWLVLFAAYASTLGLAAAPGERFSARESHVLLSAASLVSDGDLDLRDEYAARAWRSWSGPPLRPMAMVTRGRLLEPQGVAFPLLIAPAYALGGPVGVQLWLAALMAVAFVAAAALARRLVPDPWPTAAALVMGLSPPALAASTAVSPEGTGAALLAGGALAALALRERPRLGVAVAGALALALLPWLASELAVAAAVCALAMTRWLYRRQRTLAGFLTIEIVLVSVIVYVTLNNRLFGGLTPYAASLTPGEATGASSVADAIRRAPRLVGVWLDREAGLLRWAPFAALAFYALWLLWRSRRGRLAAAIFDQGDVEIAGAFLSVLCAAQLLVAAFLAPELHGPWGPARLLVPALPLMAALAAWGLRFAPRVGAALAALTLAGSAWMLLGLRIGGGGLAPARGDVPWGGAERVLPVFGGALGDGEAAAIALVALGVVGLALRERRHVC